MSTLHNYHLPERWLPRLAALLVLLAGLAACAKIFELPDPAPAPRISGIAPDSGAANTAVEISGTNFIPTLEGNLVRFNGREAVITVATATKLTALVPAGAGTGIVEVVARNLATEGPVFTYFTTPEIREISPREGEAGTIVSIYGRYFDTTAVNNIIRFGGKIAAVLVPATDTLLRAEVPADAESGEVTVTVNTITGTGPYFTVLGTHEGPLPSITAIAPTSGPAGTAVTITGENFDPVPENNAVKFNGVEAEVNQSTTTQLTAIAPVGGSTGLVSVTVAGKTVNGPTFTYVDDTDGPTISNYDPQEGYPGDWVAIVGENFSPVAAENTIQFNGTPAEVTEASATLLKTWVPEGATTGPITVTVGNQTATGPVFTVLDDAPVITDFTPKQGPVGTVVSISGSRFGSNIEDITVEFNGVAAPVQDGDGGTLVIVAVPPGASTGKITLTVRGKTATSAVDFVVAPANPPIARAVSIMTVRETLQIPGGNFSVNPAENVVMVGDFALEVISATPTLLTVYVPDGASSGKYSVTVNGVKAFLSGFGDLTEIDCLVIQWITAGALATGRTAHTATLLPNGKVLVSGGHDGFRTVYSSCELYDPATDRWSPAADMIQPRTGHTATLLPNGKVLVAGGFTDTFSEVLATCELYDPATDTWSRTGLMNSRHGYHSATLLANGKVLVVSGTDGEININFGNILLTQTCEIYDPVSGNWSATASLSERPFPVSRPTFDNTNTPLVTLPDGRVLLATHIQGVAGGGLTLVPYCQIFDPQREAWTPAAAFYEMGGRWVSPQGLTLLPNGQVLLVRGAYEGKADVYNPAANAWNRIGDNLTLPNGFAIVLNDGKVLLAGSRGTPFHQSVVLDPRTGSAYNPGNIRDRAYHAATRLPNGYVLITGGLDRFNRPTTDCQIFVPAR